MEARSAYSVLNAIFFTLLGLSGATALVGALVPIEAGMAIVLWIGIVMVAQAFQATPREHAPAVAIGLLPGIAAWGALMMKSGIRAAGVGTLEHPMGPAIIQALGRSDVAAHGAFALEQGFLLTSMIWAALTVEIIERRFVRAAMWAIGDPHERGRTHARISVHPLRYRPQRFARRRLAILCRVRHARTDFPPCPANAAADGVKRDSKEPIDGRPIL